MTDQPPTEHYWHVPRLVAAWLIALAMGLGVLVATVSPTERWQWFAVSIGLGTLITFALQLGTAQRRGFIARTALSIGGVVVVLLGIAGASFTLG